MNPRSPRAGLLPLYLELYDQRLPEMRQVLEPFVTEVATGLMNQQIQVLSAPVCRLKREVADAVASFARDEVDAIVTLHLAYSPSLEAADALCGTPLPLIICDTTMDWDFSQGVAYERMLYNHGIHGVQDLASVLRRRGRSPRIVAGHVRESQVLARTADLVRAACAARLLRHTHALRIGPSFSGMGDFAVHDATLRDLLGIRVDQHSVAALARHAAAVTPSEVGMELENDRNTYHVTASPEVHERSVRVGLALRHMLADGDYGAFSINFLSFDSADPPIDTVPFMEASKAMARGTGYAGEGDVLTAALVGALASTFGDTTFTEIFCPDWKGDSLFLSHMGEINPAIAASQPLICEKPFEFTGTRNPAIIACAPRAGDGVFVNLAPQQRGFDLLVSPVRVLGDATHPSMQDQIRGWMRTRQPVAQFLEAYSNHGGTHHSALVMGDKAEAIEAFAAFAGLGCHRV